MADARTGLRDAARWLAEIVGPDMAYLRLAIVYGVAISLGLSQKVSASVR